jgi:hypothetical protein
MYNHVVWHFDFCLILNRIFEWIRPWKTKQKHNTICVEDHCVDANTNNVNKTCTILQTTGGKDEPNIAFMRNRNGHYNTELTT